MESIPYIGLSQNLKKKLQPSKMKNKAQIIEELIRRSKKINLSDASDYGTYRTNNTFIRALLWILECPYEYRHPHSLKFALDKYLPEIQETKPTRNQSWMNI